jgi:hypothetical protein
LSDGYTKAEADAKFLDVGGDSATGSLALATASLSGNLTFNGTTQRIIGDFSSGDVNRVSFQSSTTNGFTQINAIPNGTSQVSGFTAFNNSDVNNSAYLRILPNGTEARIQSAVTGTGTYIPLTIYTGGSERVRIGTNGNTGIGQTNPSYKLDVYDSAEVVSRFARSGGSNALIIIQDPTSTTAPYISSYGNAMAFGRYAGGENARFDASGNFGVGITAPLAKLDVAASSGGITWNIKSTNTNNPNATGQGTGIQLGMSSSTDATYKWAGIASVAEAIYSNTLGLAFYTQADQSGGGANPTVNPTEKMRLTKDGWLGIGQTAPAERLEINGNAYINVASGNPYLKIKTAGAGNNPYIRMQADTNYWDIQSTFSNTNDELYFMFNGTSKAILDNSGNLTLNNSAYSWFSNRTAILLGNSVGTVVNVNDEIHIGAGWYCKTGTAIDTFLSSNYYATDFGARAGVFTWSNTAAQGTANTNVSWTERMRLSLVGNLGVGVSDPSFKITNAGHLAFTNSTSPTDGAGDSQRHGLGWHASGGTGVLSALITASNVSNWGADLQFFTRGANGGNTSERARITSTGDFLIGTTSSGGKLTVTNSGGSGNYTIKTSATTITNPNSSGSEIIGAQITVGGNIILSERQVNGAYSDRTDLAFVTNTGYGLGQSEKMRLTAGGYLGIGQSAPVAKLHIGSETEANLSSQSLFVQGSKTGYAGFKGLPQGQLLIYDDTVSTAGSGGAIGFGANTGSSQRTWIASINSERDSSSNDATNYAGSLAFYTRPAQSTPVLRVRITSGGSLVVGDNPTQGYGSGSGYLAGFQSGGSQTFISIAKSGQTLDSGGMAIGVDSVGGSIYIRPDQPLDIYTNNTMSLRIKGGDKTLQSYSTNFEQQHTAIVTKYLAHSTSARTLFTVASMAVYNVKAWSSHNSGGNYSEYAIVRSVSGSTMSQLHSVQAYGPGYLAMSFNTSTGEVTVASNPYGVDWCIVITVITQGGGLGGSGCITWGS